MRHQRTLLFFLLLFALAFSSRLAYVLIKQTYMDLRAAEMERAAICLADNGELGNAYSDDSGPTAHVSPLYPAFLAAIYRVFGSHTPAGRLAQELGSILISSLGIALLPVLARRANLERGSGWAAAFVLAVLPLNLWVETSGAWEQPAAALVLIGILFTVLALHERRWQSKWLVLLLGTLTAAAALLSPALLPAVALMLVGEFLLRAAPRMQLLRVMPLFLLPCVLIVGPWVVRNRVVLGGWVALRSNFGMQLWIGNHPGSNGKSFDLSWDDRESFIYRNNPYLSRTELSALKQVGELEYMRGKQRLAMDWIRENPGEFTSLCFQRFRLFWFPPTDLWDATAPQMNVVKAVCYSLFGLGMFGEMFFLIFTRHAGRWLWPAALLGPSLVYLVTHVDARYRYPVFALSALLGCSFLMRTANFLWKNASGGAWSGFGSRILSGRSPQRDALP
jgi:hypothetical protein